VAQGYALTSIRDFLLDGKDLAERQAKVALQGTYIPERVVLMSFTLRGEI
jgi:hypothetical protein